jgi:hypothetical protein
MCLREAKLARSHIYPKFSFRRLKKDEGKFHLFSMERGGWDPRVHQDGFWEYLLCRACEQRIGGWESDAARQIQAGIFDNFSQSTTRFCTERFVASYTSFKLYTLSILWRSCVASRDGFEQFTLGEVHEERLRSMLIRDDPGEPWEYGCVVTVPQLPIEGVHSPRAALTSVAEKFRLKGDKGLQCARMIVDGIAFHFVVGSNEAMKSWPGISLFVQRDGRLPIVIESARSMPFLNDYFETVALNDRVAPLGGKLRPRGQRAACLSRPSVNPRTR